MYFLSENFAQAENEVQSFEIRGTLVEIRKRICVALSTGIKDTREDCICSSSFTVCINVLGIVILLRKFC